MLITALAFGIMWFLSFEREMMDTKSHNSPYKLKVIDNEIRYGNNVHDTVLYRFIPVDGGTMDFAYKNRLPQTNGEEKDTVDLYKAFLEDIPSFLIGETPVTIDLFYYVMDLGFPTKGSLYDGIPVYCDTTENVWNEFIVKLEKMTGCEFEIPTNFQWEYAARGGQKSKGFKYAGSNDIDEVAKYLGNSLLYNKLNVAMGMQKVPNELGLYDMSGCIWELTSTPYIEFDQIAKYHKYQINLGKCIKGGNSHSPAEQCETRAISYYSEVMKTGLRLILKY